MRLVLFGSGSPMSTLAFEALAARFDVAAVVAPAGPRVRGLRSALRAWLRGLSRGPLVRLARARSVPVLFHRIDRVETLARSLAGLHSDLAVVATFPCLLKPPLLQAARLGAIGLHPSLLPRHRGPEPIFWTYLHDDRETGVTVFALDAGEDTGDILAQESFPLERGRPATDLYLEMSRRGAERLASVVEDFAHGRGRRVPQDASRATREPMPRPGASGVDSRSWGSERVWHVLSGLGARAGLLRDGGGGLLRHGPPQRYVIEAHGRAPGTIEPQGAGWRVYCVDGFVDVARRSRRARRAPASTA